MAPKKQLAKIKRTLMKRYGRNLAAILVFGSANAGKFYRSKSDIDTIILLKNKNNLNFEEEIILLSDKLKKINFATQYFHTLRSIKAQILKRKSWGTFIVIASRDGSLVLYSTPEFQRLKQWFRKHPLKKKDCLKYLEEKNKTDVNGYFKKTRGYDLTKSLMFHIRKQLQILNFLKNGLLVYKYKECLDYLDLDEKDNKKLLVLYDKYGKRASLRKNEVNTYYGYFRKLNRLIKKV